MKTVCTVFFCCLITSMFCISPCRADAATTMELYGTFHAMGVIVNFTTGTGNWPYCSTVVLTATPDSLSLFSGWSGDCTPAGSDCTAAMTAGRSVTATFTSAPRTMIGASGFTTLNEAYAAASQTGATTILTLDTDLEEDLAMDKGKVIILKGGYNASYSLRTGNPTSLAGVLAINSGTLTVDGLAIR